MLFRLGGTKIHVALEKSDTDFSTYVHDGVLDIPSDKEHLKRIFLDHHGKLEVRCSLSIIAFFAFSFLS